MRVGQPVTITVDALKKNTLDGVVELTLAEVSATHSAAIYRQRYAAGTATRIDWLNSERQKAQAGQNLSQATASFTNDYVALQKSLGLGWEDAPPVDPLPTMPGETAPAAGRGR